MSITKSQIIISREKTYFENFENVFDAWSNNTIIEIKKYLYANNTSNIEKNLKNQKLVKEISKLWKFKSKINDFESKYAIEKEKIKNKIQSFETLINMMPYGEQFGFDIPFEITPISTINNGSLEFLKLFKNLYYNDYILFSEILNSSSNFNDKFKNHLTNFYESLFCYPRLNLGVISLGSLTNLSKLFENTFLTPSNSKDIIPLNFYKEFLKLSLYNVFINEDEITYFPELNNLKKNYYCELNNELWSNNFLKEGQDSYGIFFKRPGLLEYEIELKTVKNAYGRDIEKKVELFKERNIDDNVNISTGSWETKTGIYTFDPRNDKSKISLFLFLMGKTQNQTDTSKPTYFEYSGTTNTSKDIVYENEILKYYYNYNNNAIFDNKDAKYNDSISSLKPSKNINLKEKIDERKLYKNSSEQLLGITPQKIMSGGSIKQNGGKSESLFDTSSSPALYANRKLTGLNYSNFKTIGTYFKSLISTEKIKQIKLNYNKIVNIPLFYNSKDEFRIINKEGTTNNEKKLTYSELYEILVFCNVVSNNFKLIAHFLETISNCLDFIKNKYLQKKNNNYNSTNDIKNIVSNGIDKLKENIQNAINQINIIITLKGKKSDNDISSKKLFFGLDIEYLEEINNEALERIVENYIFFTDSYDKQKFINIIRKISSWETLDKKPIVFGGFSIVSKERNILNDFAFNTYEALIRARKISNNNLLNNYNKYVNRIMTNKTISKDIINKITNEQIISFFNQPQKPLDIKLSEILSFFLRKLAETLISISKKNAINTNNQNEIIRQFKNTNEIKKIYMFDTDIFDRLQLSRSRKSQKYIDTIKSVYNYFFKDNKLDRIIRDPTMLFYSKYELKYKLYLLREYMEYFKNSKTILEKEDIDKYLKVFLQIGIANFNFKLSFEKAPQLVNPNRDFREWWYQQYNYFQEIFESEIPKKDTVKKLYIFLITKRKIEKGFKFDYYFVDLFASAYAENNLTITNNNFKLNDNILNEENIIIKIEPRKTEDLVQSIIKLQEKQKKLGNVYSPYVKTKIINNSSYQNLKTKTVKNLFKQYDILSNLFSSAYQCRTPFLNSLDTESTISYKTLEPFLLTSDTENNNINVFLNSPKDQYRNIFYPVVFVEDNDNDPINKRNATELLSSMKNIRKFMYELTLSYSFNNKFYRDIKSIQFIPSSSNQTESMIEYSKFLANKALIEEIYDNLIFPKINKTNASKFSGSSYQYLYSNGLINKQFLSNKLISN